VIKSKINKKKVEPTIAVCLAKEKGCKDPKMDTKTGYV
jgi:hypothetical protein